MLSRYTEAARPRLILVTMVFGLLSPVLWSRPARAQFEMPKRPHVEIELKERPSELRELRPSMIERLHQPPAPLERLGGVPLSPPTKEAPTGLFPGIKYPPQGPAHPRTIEKLPPLIERPLEIELPTPARQHLADLIWSIGPVGAHPAAPFQLLHFKAHPHPEDSPPAGTSDEEPPQPREEHPETIVTISRDAGEKTIVRIAPDEMAYERALSEVRRTHSKALVMLQRSRHPLECLEDLTRPVTTLHVLDYAPSNPGEFAAVYGKSEKVEGVEFRASPFELTPNLGDGKTIAERLREPETPGSTELTAIIAHVENGMIRFPDGSGLPTSEVILSHTRILIACDTRDTVAPQPGLHFTTRGPISVDQARAVAQQMLKSAKTGRATRESMYQDLQNASPFISAKTFWAPESRLTKPRGLGDGLNS